ncbi:hypothetical protein VF21_06607 [Pseudogymnoascus sp. 05NY08]|nr:hypothetical protein VF21_06607 [Pseudogymnoascus sp. 05NY08]
MVVGAILQASTYGAVQLIVGRIISGVGNGINTSTIPIYVSEMAKSNRRGRMIAIQLSVVIIVWRLPIAFQIVFALITLATMPFLPETPRWLYSHGKEAEAVQVLARLMSCREDDPRVRMIKGEMKAALEIETIKEPFRWQNIFYDRTDLKNYRRLILCFFIQMMQQFTGINVIAFYVTIVLEVNVGFDRETASLVAGFIQIAFWAGTFPPMWLIDRYGRRPMLLCGSIALTTTMVVFTISIALDTPATSKLALAMLLCYEISFGMSWNSIPWLLAPEITPLHLRHIGSAIGPFSEWLWTFVIVLITPTAIRNAGWKFYILFCIMNMLCIPFIWICLPETNGKTLEEIDYVFANAEAKERIKSRFDNVVANANTGGSRRSSDSDKMTTLEVERIV